MLTYGGREATGAERTACLDFISRFSQQQETLQFPEVAVLETDSFGRVMMFLRVLHEDGFEEPLLIIFLAVVVGTIVIALFMPLVSIIGGLSG